MRYRVTFLERTNASGDPSEYPPEYVEVDLPEGVVLDCTFVDRSEPAALHLTEHMDEDDDFLSIGTETWDYDIDDARLDDFLAAVKNSEIAIECVLLEES